MKLTHKVTFLIIAILLIDQIVKIVIKTNMSLGESIPVWDDGSSFILLKTMEWPSDMSLAENLAKLHSQFSGYWQLQDYYFSSGH